VAEANSASSPGSCVGEVVPPDVPVHLVPVIEALLSGQTDEAACKRLGISGRTFSRRVAEVLNHLNVATRFQAGAELVRRASVQRDSRAFPMAPGAESDARSTSWEPDLDVLET
jgi:hypothetical protein